MLACCQGIPARLLRPCSYGVVFMHFCAHKHLPVEFIVVCFVTCSDLVPLIRWNEAHGIRLFRLSSNIFPWMTSYKFEDLPHWPDIQKVGMGHEANALWQP